MSLLRIVLWIVAGVLAFVNWLMKEQWLGGVWEAAMAALVIVLVGLGAWIAIDWREARRAARKLPKTD